jgi:ubiquinone/menaquinone biosynthesis C-methylase UbiE
VFDMTASRSDGSFTTPHQALIQEQFTQQAELFANAPVLHDAAALDALVQAASPRASDVSLDVACGPGTVVATIASHVAHATGLDATAAMLDQARKLAGARGLANVSWRQGDVCALPFDDAAFDILSCRFAMHHFERPEAAFAEMARVCRPGGRVVLCDAVASDDPAKAKAFNEMERFRDPSTVEFRTLAFLAGLFGDAGLAEPVRSFYTLPVEMEALLKTSFPLGDDRDGLRALLRDAAEGDKMGINARREGETVRFEYAAVILAATKP